MSRIQTTFEQLKAQNKKALIPYLTGGDPHPDFTVELMHHLVEEGADILEVGVPFSDPMADGPTIQLACERALVHNVSLTQVLEMVKTFREKDSTTPVVLMGYLNPIEVMGYQNFVDRASDAGVDGILAVDLPPEESGDFVPMLRAKNMDSIYLLSPTTTDQRIAQILEYSSGYVYYVSLKGVTGSNALDVDDVARNVNRIKALTEIPVGVGFGIRDGETANAVGSVSDGVIVGSALVNQIAKHQTDINEIKKQLSVLMQDLRAGLDR